MTVKSEQAWAGLFVTLDATGALAAGTPSGTLYVDGVADGATVTITGNNPYKFAVTLPTLTAGQRVDMYITATISSIATAGVVASAQADTILSSDIVGADSDTLETLSDQLDKVTAKTDLLDTSSITVVSAVEGSTITILRGDTFNPPPLTNLGALTDYVSIDFTVKSDKLQTDDEAAIRIRKNASGVDDGLLRLNGAAPTTETGSITIDDEATGDITITLDETATDDLSTGSYSYDIQLITATTVKTLTYGKLTVISDVTRAVV
jgi:hypothetical protein